MSKKSTKPTSRSFNRLLKAKDAQEIADAVNTCCWEADGNEGESPRLPFVDLQAFTDADLTAQYVDSCALVSEKHNWVDVTLKSDIERIVGMGYDDWLEHEKKKMLKAAAALDKMAKERGISINQLIDNLKAESEQRRQEIEKLNSDEHYATVEDFNKVHEKRLNTTILNAEQFHAVGLFLAASQNAPTETPLEWLHQVWLRSREHDPTITHPLVPIVRAWLQEQSAKHITPEYDRKHPAAILKHPMGSIRDLSFTEPGTAHLREFATPASIKEMESQLHLEFADSLPSILPSVMPLEVAHPLGLKEKTRSGAVSHVIRIFFEALMALEPSQREGELMFRLRDLIRYLYPDGKFNRTNQLPYLIQALDILHFYATVPWDNGRSRWRPVVVRSVIDIDAENDTAIYLDVKIPPDATQGMVVEKAIMRVLGKKSAPKFNAYLTACWLFDKYGTLKGKLIDPTRPVERRNKKGQLVDPTGKIIVSPRGKPVESIYHSAAVKRLDREPNPAADRYPVLSEDDLLFSCFPNGYKTTRRVAIQRAKKHWEELASTGIVEIHKKSRGWQIVPSEGHIKTHRGVREAAKKKVY